MFHTLGYSMTSYNSIRIAPGYVVGTPGLSLLALLFIVFVFFNFILSPSNNYPVAVDKIKKRFGQLAKFITAHMRALVAIPKLGLDRASLREFVDYLESHIRDLAALSKKTDSYGNLLVCVHHLE